MKHLFQLLTIVLIGLIPIRSLGQISIQLDPNSAANISAATYLSSSQNIAFFSQNALAFYPIYGEINELAWYPLDPFRSISGAVAWGPDNMLIFEGANYLNYQISSGIFVSEWGIWGGLPVNWNNQLDAVVQWDANTLFFFKDTEFVSYDLNSQNYVAAGNVIDWAGWPLLWNNGIQAACNLQAGHIYFFNRGQLMPYEISSQSFYIPANLSVQTAPTYAPVPPAPIPGNVDQGQTNISAVSTEAQPQGCRIGESGLKRNQTKLSGNQNGRSMSSNIPKGHRIKSVQVFSSKVWGKEVISGIMTISEDKTGKEKQQLVLGKRTTTKRSLDLEIDECITSVSGSAGSGEGEFINSLEIETTYQNLRCGSSNGSSFEYRVPDSGQFEGFQVAFQNNLTGLGIIYCGENEKKSLASKNTSQNNSSGQYASITSTSSANQGMQNVPPSTNYNAVDIMTGNADDYYEEDVNTNMDVGNFSGEYWDGYEDYTPGHEGGSDFMSIQPLPGIDWLGAGFDILKFDPLRPNNVKNRKSFRAIVLTNSPQRAGNSGTKIKPYGTFFSSSNSGEVVDSNAWITSYKQYSTTFGLNASGSVAVPGVASGSLSGSYSEMNSGSLGSESIYMISKTKRSIHQLELRETWKDQNTGQKCKQKLTPAFKDDVMKLPVTSADVPNLNITQKNQKLPPELSRLKAKYDLFISKFGTHYTKKVIWGGHYITKTEVKRADYEKSRMTESGFKNTAEIQIKQAEIGRAIDFNTGEGSSKGNSTSNSRKLVFVEGGNGEDDIDKWRDKVDKTPAPIEMEFMAICDLLTLKMFENDPDIDKKKEILRIMTEKYIWDTYREPIVSRMDFFRPLPELPMPGSIAVKNGGGYVMWFTVTYKHEGKYHEDESGSFSFGHTKTIEIPIGATDIKVVAAQTTSEIFTKTYDKPPVECFTTWGTIFETAYGKCGE